MTLLMRQNFHPSDQMSHAWQLSDEAKPGSALTTCLLLVCVHRYGVGNINSFGSIRPGDKFREIGASIDGPSTDPNTILL
jgi:hypothetical protein